MNVAGDREQRRRRSAACLSPFALERLHHGELDGTGEGARARRHLEECLECGARLARLSATPAPAMDVERLIARSAREVVLEPRAAETVPARRRTAARAVGALLGGLAMVLAGAVLLGPVDPAPPDQRTKGGGWQLTVIAQRPDGRIGRVAAGDTLAPGDRLLFEVGHPSDGFAAIVSLDSRGAVTAFYPSEGEAAAVKGGERHLSDRSVVLDDALGPERIILAGCDRPFTVDSVLTAARQALARAHGLPLRVERLDLPCAQTLFWINKVAR